MTNQTFIKIGWWLFVLSASFFIVASWRAGDMVALIGSFAFLAVNISFMIALYRGDKK